MAHNAEHEHGSPGVRHGNALSGSDSGPRPWQHALAMAWVAGFVAYFFSLDVTNDQIPRADLAAESPVILLNLVDPYPADRKDAQAVAVERNSGWRYLPQRIDLLLVAATLLAGAWGLGHLSLRSLRVPLAASSLERTVFAFGCGLAALSLLTLTFGLAGWLSRPLFLGIIVVGAAAEAILQWRARSRGATAVPVIKPAPSASVWNIELPGGRDLWIGLVVGGPFLLAMLLGALLPSTDFDVNEYHFEGPKEYYQNGRVTFLPHNVYTSFPFGTEMLTLLAMVLRQDWYRGALAGKAALFSFAPLTALALYAAGRRWFSPAAGLAAALIYLSTPWIYRISIIAYAEGGLCFYLFATLLAVGMCLERPEAPRLAVLAGILAGSGFACKYPGALSVVIPLAVGLGCGVRNPPRLAVRTVALFALGVAITAGPWLLKNAVETRNPVYPLLYRVFGGRDWDDELNAKWKQAHGPKECSVRELGNSVNDMTAKSDWLSPLLFAFAPLALLRRQGRRAVRGLWLYVGWLFLTWWVLTHRIDRFWVPMLPVVALLAGAGVTWIVADVSDRASHRRRLVLAWQALCGGCLMFGVLFNLAFIVTPYCGLNSYLLDLRIAEALAANICVPEIVQLNQQLPPDARVLSVGDAQVFDARFPVVYNTVFDHSIFEDWTADPQPGVPANAWPLRDTEAIRKKLTDAGITHIYVNWREILRYRSPENYGYTDFVAPGRFRELQRLGILGPTWHLTGSIQPLDKLDAGRQQAVQTWGKDLIVDHAGTPSVMMSEVFPVRSPPDRQALP